MSTKFADIYPVVAAEIADIKAAINKICRDAINDLSTAFFADFPQVSSFQWQQIPLSNSTVGITNFVFNGNDPSNLSMQLAIQKLRSFLGSLAYHLQCAYGVNVWVTVTPSAIASVPTIQVRHRAKKSR